MVKGEFDLLYLCAEGGGLFSFDKSTSLEGGQKENSEMITGLSKK